MASISELGNVLLKQGVITLDQLNSAFEEHKKSGKKFSQILIQRSFIKESQLCKALGVLYGFPSIDLSRFDVDPAAIPMVTREVCLKYTVFPVSKVESTLVFAFADPSNVKIKDELSFITRCKIQIVVAPEYAIVSAVEKYYGAEVEKENALEESDNLKLKDEKPQIESSDVVIQTEEPKVDEKTVHFETDKSSKEAFLKNFVERVFSEAIRFKATDIHFELFKKRMRIRFRIDGELHETLEPPFELSTIIIKHIKEMAGFDPELDFQNKPGQIKFKTELGEEFGFSLHTIKTIWGDKLTLKRLDKTEIKLELDILGFEADDLQKVKNCLRQSQGMMLVVGSSGQGKTTTVYSILNALNNAKLNIITVESNLSAHLSGINQVIANDKESYEEILKYSMYQDPDIVVVEDINELKTAEYLLKVVSSKHLVIGTLNAIDSAEAISKLIEMGVSPYSLISNLKLIVAQQLLGKVCENCKITIDTPKEALLALGVKEKEIEGFRLSQGRGCEDCRHTGIKGRIPLFELLSLSEKLKKVIVNKEPSEKIRRAAQEEGVRLLKHVALLKLKNGQTTLSELMNSSIKDY